MSGGAGMEEMRFTREIVLIAALIMTIIGLIAEQNTMIISILGWIAMAIIIIYFESKKK